MREYVGNKMNDTCTSGKCIYNDSNTTLSIESTILISVHYIHTSLSFVSCVLYRLLPHIVPSHGRECVRLLQLGHGGESSTGARAYVWFRAIFFFSVTKFFTISKLFRDVGRDGRIVRVIYTIFIWKFMNKGQRS